MEIVDLIYNIIIFVISLVSIFLNYENEDINETTIYYTKILSFILCIISIDNIVKFFN